MTGYTCGTCGEFHAERPTAFGLRLPEAIHSLAERDRAARAQISPEMCTLDRKHFFVLGNLDVPVLGGDETIRWTVWSTLSLRSFERTVELWETPGRESEPPSFGWLANAIPGYAGSLYLPLEVRTNPVGVRPTLRLHGVDHPLARNQRDGIPRTRADELIGAALHGGL